MVNDLLKECMQKGFFLDREILDLFNSMSPEKTSKVINVLKSLNLREKVITKKVFERNLITIKKFIPDFNESLFFEKEIITSGEDLNLTKGDGRLKVKLINAPAFPQRKITVNDFVKHFRSRFEIIKSSLENRDFDDLTSIRKIGNNGSHTIIGCVLQKKVTKNKNIMLTVEDLTGVCTILVNQNKKEVFDLANDLLFDDIVAFSVSGSSNLLFCNNIHFPEVSLLEKRYAKEDIWVAFISDLHCGSMHFLEKEFLKFIKWINNEGDNTYGGMVNKIKYLFVNGDLVDGVNHYPGQEKDLNIFSCTGQYKKFEELIKLIRKDIEIIICPGNHDAVWVGEPQPIISDKWAPGLHSLENVHMVPSPALIEIEGDFRILMYHGASINAFVEEISEIRTKYGRQQPTMVVREMIKRRHLAPMHGLVDYIPCEIDPMVINPTPDIIVTGDLHTVDIGCKNNILMIANSCWQSSTPFMEKIGVNPDPCKVPLFNLKTREIKILDFSDATKEVEWSKDHNLFCELNGDFSRNKNGIN